LPQTNVGSQAGAAFKTETRTELLREPRPPGMEFVLRIAAALKAKPKGWVFEGPARRGLRKTGVRSDAQVAARVAARYAKPNDGAGLWAARSFGSQFNAHICKGGADQHPAGGRLIPLLSHRMQVDHAQPAGRCAS
jgi:hypothetical protein